MAHTRNPKTRTQRVLRVIQRHMPICGPCYELTDVTEGKKSTVKRRFGQRVLGGVR